MRLPTRLHARGVLLARRISTLASRRGTLALIPWRHPHERADHHPDPSRRDFLLAGGAGALALTAAEALADKGKPALPQKTLGRTNVKVPILGLGTAPAGFRKEKEAVAFFNNCIDSGLTYLDTAPELGGYGKAQVYLGKVLKERRKEVLRRHQVLRAGRREGAETAEE